MILQRLLIPLATVTFVGLSFTQSQEKKIEMVPVKYGGLKEEVLKHRGKVVLVDFWAGY